MKIAVGEKVAGKFQYNRFAALMNNSDYYQKAYSATQNADGSVDEMQDKYADSIQGRLNTLQASAEQVMTSLFDQDNVEPILGGVTQLVNLINSLVNTLNGGLPIFTAISAILLKTFSSQIAEQIQRISTNIEATITSMKSGGVLEQTYDQLGISDIADSSTKTTEFAVGNASKFGVLSSNTQEAYVNQVQQMSAAEEELLRLQEQQVDAVKLLEKDRTMGLSAAREQVEAAQQEVNKYKELEQEQAEISEIEQKSYQKAQQKISVYNSLVEKLENGVTLSDREIDKLGEEAKYLKQSQNTVAKINQELGTSERLMANLEDSSKALTSRMDTEALIGGVTKGISGLTSVAFAVQSLDSAISAINNEDLDFGEKMSQGFMSLLTMIPMLVSGFKEVNTLVQTTAASVVGVDADKLAESKQKAAEATKLEAEAETLAAEAKKAGTAADEAMAAAEMNLNAKKAAGNALTKDYRQVEAAKLAQQKANALAIESETTAEKANEAATMSNTLAKEANAKAARAAAVANGVLLAATIAITVAYEIFSQQQQAAEKKAEKLKESIEDNSTALESLSTNVDSFNELYQTYVKTGDGADNLSSSAKTLNEALDDQMLKVYAAEENWAKYAERLKEVSKEQSQTQLTTATNNFKETGQSWKDTTSGVDI